jgi:hypothetical protein
VDDTGELVGHRAFRPGLASMLLDTDGQVVAYLIRPAFADARAGFDVVRGSRVRALDLR